MIVDFDDFCEDNHRLDLLHELKAANPLFRCTLFAVPARGSTRFWEDVPRWCELAVHGWEHPDPFECNNWDTTRALELLRDPIVKTHFVRGFKAPGWQISDGCYEALCLEDWWVADQIYNDGRRPDGLLTHRYDRESPYHWHGHIQNVEGNGLEETWDELLAQVIAATHFEWIGEMVTRW